MVKQDWMVIVAGEALVDALTAETMALVPKNGSSYASESLVELQRRRASNGIVGAEIVKSMYGHSVRYDSGLQNFGLLASSKAKQIDGSLEAAEQWCRDWVAKDPEHRYAWRRK